MSNQAANVTKLNKGLTDSELINIQGKQILSLQSVIERLHFEMMDIKEFMRKTRVSYLRRYVELKFGKE